LIASTVTTGVSGFTRIGGALGGFAVALALGAAGGVELTFAGGALGDAAGWVAWGAGGSLLSVRESSASTSGADCGDPAEVDGMSGFFVIDGEDGEEGRLPVAGPSELRRGGLLGERAGGCDGGRNAVAAVLTRARDGSFGRGGTGGSAAFAGAGAGGSLDRSGGSETTVSSSAGASSSGNASVATGRS
jgi:hypothetical protein